MRTLFLFGAMNQSEWLVLVVLLLIILIATYKMGQKSGATKVKATEPAPIPTPIVDKVAITTKLNEIKNRYKGTYGYIDADKRYGEVQGEMNKTNDPALIKAFTDAVIEIYKLPGIQ